MPHIDDYIEAATRPNTRKAYRNAITHYEVHWKGFLPASADRVCQYLVDHAGTYSSSTLQVHLAALSEWHQTQGYADPTKAPAVKKTLRGIRMTHPRKPKQAKALSLELLETVVKSIECSLTGLPPTDQARLGALLRDRALILISFWRAYRSDEVCRMAIEHIALSEGRGMEIYFPYTKRDREALGDVYRLPALNRLCPVRAYSDWLHFLGEAEGPVFRKIDRWGNISDTGLHHDSIIGILRARIRAAGLDDSDCYTSHSLRRGFASWAASEDWSLRDLMEYVGWTDPKSALRYIDPTQSYAAAINTSLDKLPTKDLLR